MYATGVTRQKMVTRLSTDRGDQTDQDVPRRSGPELLGDQTDVGDYTIDSNMDGIQDGGW